MNSLVFIFGTSAGEYDASLGYVTDSIFGLGKVSHIIYSNQAYDVGFVQGDRYLDYSSVFTAGAGSQMTVVFSQSIKIYV